MVKQKFRLISIPIENGKYKDWIGKDLNNPPKKLKQLQRGLRKNQEFSKGRSIYLN